MGYENMNKILKIWRLRAIRESDQRGACLDYTKNVFNISLQPWSTNPSNIYAEDWKIQLPFFFSLGSSRSYLKYFYYNNLQFSYQRRKCVCVCVCIIGKWKPDNFARGFGPLLGSFVSALGWKSHLPPKDQGCWWVQVLWLGLFMKQLAAKRIVSEILEPTLLLMRN